MTNEKIENAIKNFVEAFLLSRNQGQIINQGDDISVSFNFNTKQLNLNDSSNTIDQQLIDETNEYIKILKDKFSSSNIQFQDFYQELELNDTTKAIDKMLKISPVNFQKLLDIPREKFIKIFN